MKRKSHKRYFAILFLIFGAVIALSTSIVNYNLDIKNIKTELKKEAHSELLRKGEEMASFTKLLEGYVASLRNNQLLHDFIKHPTPENRRIVNSLFYAAANSNPAFMQVRYLDEKGFEKIRVDWHVGRQQPQSVEEEAMQDKGARYYFVEAAQVPANTYWYSRLDLNVENNTIEVPHRPVLRIASPVYVLQKFKGIVIVNIHAKTFLSRFGQSPFFNISLVDGDGNFIVHYNDNYSWSRYLQTGHQLSDEYPLKSAVVLGGNTQGELLDLDNFYAASMAKYLPQDQAHIVFVPKKRAVQTLRGERRKATLFIVGTIFLLSIPLSLLISRIPARLNEKIAAQNKILQEYLELIDQNIITSTTDKNGVITEVSSAFLQISGFNRSELIGVNQNVVIHFDMSDEFFRSMWATIASGQRWQGDTKNRAKDGSVYWTENTIFPKYGSTGEIIEYEAIYHDITDKKRIEELSITDDLTSLYNRRYFNEVLFKEVGRAMREKKTITFAMLDVDHFKQYNDHYGHQKGDEVLAVIGQTLKSKLDRSSDFCFRLGGEEFGIIFSGLESAKAFHYAEAIRAAVENLKFEHRWNSAADVVTISMGILSIIPEPGITADLIYRNADEALYAAKAEGRNQIVGLTKDGRKKIPDV